MSTTIDMMRLRDPALARRMEALTGEDGACCIADLAAEARAVAAGETFQRAVARAKALADERRLLALALLKRRGDMCGCELQAALGLTHATISHHMTALADAGLVTKERRGKWVYYALTSDARRLTP